MAWFLVQGFPVPMSGNRPDNSLPIPPGPVDPGYSPPWAQVPPGTGPGGPVDPGYSPPWAQVRPPVDPGYSPPWAQVPPGTGPGGPVDPGYSPPWARPQPPRPGWPTVPGWPGGSLPGGIEGFPHPSHPIYIPITPPPDSGLEPTHPIYIPVYPSQGPGFPSNPIANPGDPNNPGGPAKAEFLKKVKAAVDFWTGNLPTDPNAPPTPTPV